MVSVSEIFIDRLEILKERKRLVSRSKFKLLLSFSKNKRILSVGARVKTFH